MRKQLFIQLAENDGASWVLLDDERPAGTLFRGLLGDAVKSAAGARVVLLAPAMDILQASIGMPNLSRNRLSKAVPFALEEQLAGDVDELHFALANRDATGQVAGSVVARTRIDSWLDSLKTAGLQADVVASEVLAVPLAEPDGSMWSLLLDGERCLLRTGPRQGQGFDADNLPAMLRAALDEKGEQPPSRLDVYLCQAEGIAESATLQALRELCEAQDMRLELYPQEEDCAVLLARGFDEQQAINLLQGDYSRREQLEKLLRPWRPALALLGLWLLMQVGLMGMEYQHLAAKNQTLREQVEAVYRDAFPGSRLVTGQERALMERGLEKLRGGSQQQVDFLALLGQAGAVLAKTEGLKLRTVRYKGDKLDVDLEIADLQALDKLKQQLTDEAKMSVEIVSASSREGRVESRLALGGGA